MTLFDDLATRLAAIEKQYGDASHADAAEMADELFGERGIKAEWFIETGLDTAGQTYWEVSICHDGEEVLTDYFYSREAAENYIRAFTNVMPIDGE
jgi:hypothetical protein